MTCICVHAAASLCQCGFWKCFLRGHLERASSCILFKIEMEGSAQCSLNKACSGSLTLTVMLSHRVVVKLISSVVGFRAMATSRHLIAIRN